MTARVLIQVVLLLPALLVAGVLPMLFVAVPQLIAEEKWLGAAFNLLALPGLVALLASVVLPQRWQERMAVRRALVVGLTIAGAVCIMLAIIMSTGPGNGLRVPREPMQFALILGPLIVVIWNLARLAGRTYAFGACAFGCLAFATGLWVAAGGLDGCRRDYDAATGEHTACR
ncbi:hypothetical protein [Mesorhizobium sp. CAU 1741]|uniref:hypothetical protein n=1 Tax=Mesorhizobium sp. CAU 1741 TaxID=3140366 RepID=UPI00325B9B62